MSKYKDSFNVIIGTSNTEIDLNYNKYVSFNVYRIGKKPGQAREMSLAEDIKLG
tara:strand:+ start:354 stop:515 length:162 start_codon:yes stop_codon:yes gene_type:complete